MTQFPLVFSCSVSRVSGELTLSITGYNANTSIVLRNNQTPSLAQWETFFSALGGEEEATLHLGEDTDHQLTLSSPIRSDPLAFSSPHESGSLTLSSPIRSHSLTLSYTTEGKVVCRSYHRGDRCEYSSEIAIPFYLVKEPLRSLIEELS